MLSTFGFTAAQVRVAFEPPRCAVLQSVTTCRIVIVGRKHPDLICTIMEQILHPSLVTGMKRE